MVSKVFNSDFYKFFTDYKLILILLYCILNYIFYRYLLLENLLSSSKVLNINVSKKPKPPKETNWKQKFQKPQNENICLTYLNTETLCKREQSQACLDYAECSQGSPRGK